MVNADVVSAALTQMLEIAMDRDSQQATRLSILKRRIVSLQVQVGQQATEINTSSSAGSAATPSTELRTDS